MDTDDRRKGIESALAGGPENDGTGGYLNSLSGNRQQPSLATGFSLLIPITLSTMAIVLLAPVLPQLQADYASVAGAPYLVPIVLTMPALCVAFLSPLAGILGDRFGRRRLLMAALVFYAVVGVAPVFLSNLGAIIGTRVIVGMAEALIMVLSTTLIGDYYVGPKRDRWLAAQTAVASISALLFFNVGGFLGSFGWRTPFWVYGSALLMMIAIWRNTWEPKGDSVRAELAVDSSAAAFPWGAMAGVVAVTIFASILFYTVQIQASVGLAELGLRDPARVGFLTSLASIGVPLGTLVFTRIGIGKVARLLSVEFALMSVGFLMMAKAGGQTGFLVGCAINQFGAGLLLPTLLVWAMTHLHFSVRGRGTGLWNGAFALGQFLSPLIVTFFALRMGVLPAFSVLSWASLLAMLVAGVLAATQRRLQAA